MRFSSGSRSDRGGASPPHISNSSLDGNSVGDLSSASMIPKPPLPQSDLDRVLIEGPVAKWTNYYYAWKTRYFSLAHGVLRYSHAKGEHFRGSYPLSEDAKLRINAGDSTRLDLQYNFGVLYLKFESHEERRLWHDALKKAKTMNTRRKASLAFLTNDTIGSLGNDGPVTPSGAADHQHEVNVSRNSFASQAGDPSHILGAAVDEIDPLLDLLEQSRSTRRELNTTRKEINYLQSSLLRVSHKCRDTEYREEVKDLILNIVQSLDRYIDFTTAHLHLTESTCQNEAAQKRKVEKAVCQLAKANYNLERYAARTRTDPSVVRREVAAAYTSSHSAHGIFDRAEVPSEIPGGDVEESEGDTSDGQSDHADMTQGQEFYDVEEEELSPASLVYEQKAEKEEKDTKEPAPGEILRRVRLPVQRTEFKIRLWTLLKGCIGRDLSRISMPVYFNEPTSLLQRIAEDYQYAHILDKASSCCSSVERLLWVAVFTVSPYASAVGRTYKPFNPLLGETFEFSHRGFRFLSEQVGHHPPVSAYYCESQNFAAWGSMAVTNRFTGRSLEIAMPGTAHIYLPNTPDQDHYTFGRGRMLINNIIFGKLVLEIVGMVTVVNHITGDYAVIEFLRYGWWDASRHVIRGVVFDRNGVAVYKLGGIWSRELWVEECILPDGYETPRSNAANGGNSGGSISSQSKSYPAYPTGSDNCYGGDRLLHSSSKFNDYRVPKDERHKNFGLVGTSPSQSLRHSCTAEGNSPIIGSDRSGYTYNNNNIHQQSIKPTGLHQSTHAPPPPPSTPPPQSAIAASVAPFNTPMDLCSGQRVVASAPGVRGPLTHEPSSPTQHPREDVPTGASAPAGDTIGITRSASSPQDISSTGDNFGLQRPRTRVCEGVKCLLRTPPAVGGKSGDAYNFDFDSYKTAAESYRVVWRPESRPSWSSAYYDFGYMTFELNELTPDYDPSTGTAMPSTDSRFRPDQRAYENGDFEVANEEKCRMEEKQRERARLRANGEDDYSPRWFVRGTNSVTGEPCWLFNGDYWERKRAGMIGGCVDIFGLKERNTVSRH